MRIYYFIAISNEFVNRQYRMFGVNSSNLDEGYNYAWQHFTNGIKRDSISIYFSHTYLVSQGNGNLADTFNHLKQS